MKLFSPAVVPISAFLVLLIPSHLAAQGEDNPTGVAGIYNGNVTTGCSYDPYTGNALRVVDDIVVPGTVGAYPLKWTRYSGTRGGGMSYIYGLSNYGLLTFPDGRTIDFNDPPSGIDIYLGSWNGKSAAVLPDGGKVVFDVIDYNYYASAVVDPYGQATTIERDSAKKIIKVTEPGGRYLKINWGTIGNNPPMIVIQSVQAFDHQNAGGSDGNLLQSVTYTWSIDAPNGAYSHPGLIRADYNDGTFASYTNKLVGHDEYRQPQIFKRDDVRYSGPMRQIEYDLDPKGVLQAEKNFVTHEAVSTRIGDIGNQSGGTHYPIETRGDGATRSFHYGGKLNQVPQGYTGKLLDYTDCENHTTTLTYEEDRFSYSYGFIKSVTDANGHTTTYTRNSPEYPTAWGIHKITYADSSFIEQIFTDEDNPAYLSSRTAPRKTGDPVYTTTYTRDTNMRITCKDYPDGSYEIFNYDNNAFGLVGWHRMTNGAYQHFQYDSRGLLTAKWNPTWNATALQTDPQTTYTYYHDGHPWTDRIETETDPLGHVTVYEYDYAFDANGQMTSTKCAGRGLVTKISHPDDTHKDLYPAGTYQLFAYNKYGDKLWEENELGQRTTYTYDDYGRVLTVKNPLNKTTTYTYTPTNGTNPSPAVHTTNCAKTITSPTGIVTQNIYDKNFRKSSTTTGFGTSLAATTTFEYDYVGNPTKVTDPLNHATTTDYDNRDRKWHVTDALVHTTTFGYDARGNVTSIQRPDQTIETKTYDAMNRMLTDTVPQNATVSLTTSFVYNASGTIHSVTDPKLQTTTFEYDASDVKTKMIYPNNIDYQEWTFDPAKNLIARRTVNGTVQYFGYDERNRKSAMSWSNGADWAIFRYDAAGRLVEANNGISSIAREYDPAGRLTLDQQILPPPPPVMPVTVVSRKTHGSAGVFDINLPLTGTVAVEPRSGSNHKLVLTFARAAWYTGVSVTTGTGTIANATTSGDGTEITLDLTGVTNAQTIVITLAGVTDGTVTNNVSVGMAVLFGDVNGNGGVTVSDVNICRSQVGIEVTTSTFLSDVNLSGGITVSDVNTIRAQVGAALPAAGPLTQTGPANHAVNVRYVCDDDGKQTRLYVDGTDYDRAFTYDATGRFKQILNGVGGPVWFEYSYDTASNEILRHNQLNGVDQVYTRDELNRMSRRDVKKGTNTISYEAYGFDVMSRLSSIDREDAKRDAFGYDFTSQLTSAQYGLSFDGTQWINPQRPVGYVWDKAGNRQSVTDTGATSNYTTTNLNQYTFAGADAVYNGTEHEISNYQGKTYGYINDERLAWITSTTDPNQTDSYQLAYDALGRCVRRTLNGVVSYYAYDGEKPILEFNNVYQKIAANIYGKAIDEILMRTDYSVTPNATFYYQDDHEGSVTHLMDGNGNVIESYRYDAFGAPTIFDSSLVTRPSSQFNNRFMFTGREYAQKFGIYEYRARAYHPGLGRFTSEDPMGYAAGDYNLFRYCGNDPIDKTDPMGLSGRGIDNDTGATAEENQGTNGGTPAEVKSKENFEAFKREFDAKAVEANKHTDSRLTRLGVKDYITKMIELVRKDPTQFHDPNFIRSVVMAIGRAFLDNRIKVGVSAQFQGPRAKSTMLTIRKEGVATTYANPNSMPKRVDMPMHLGHEGYHQLVPGEGLRFEVAATNGPGYELGSRLGAPSARQFTPKQIRSFYPGMPGFEGEE